MRASTLVYALILADDTIMTYRLCGDDRTLLHRRMIKRDRLLTLKSYDGQRLYRRSRDRRARCQENRSDDDVLRPVDAHPRSTHGPVWTAPSVTT